MARRRAYRSSWLWIPAVAISSIAQSAAVITYQYTRPTPQPFLTIRLDDAAASWDSATTTLSHDDKTSLKIVSASASGFKVAIKMPAGDYFGNVPQKFDMPDRDATVHVTLTAPDGTTWTKAVEIKKNQETLLGVDYTPARGQVLVTREGESAPILRCAQPRCTIALPPDTKVTLTAVIGEDSTFGGFHQYPMRTPAQLVPWLGDPLEPCLAGDAVEAAKAGHVYDCGFPLHADTDVTAEFVKKPEAVEVAFTDAQLDKLIKPLTPPPPPTPIDAEKLDADKPLVVAIAPPPKVLPPPVVPPPPPPPEQKKPPPPQQPPPNMTMVEVKDDKNVKDKPDDDAKFLSDKNRSVAEETRAQKTNLEKESEGKSEASKENDDKTSAEIGGPDDKIRQLEETKATTDKRMKETDHSGDKQTAKGEIRGEGGNNGEEGTGDSQPGILSMRGVGGRGSIVDQKDGKKIGKRGLPGVNSQMAFNDYERIVGKEKVDEERQVSARKMSAKKGRWERKLDAIKSSLENFVPDVRPGNQTALKTRAHPYALYIARMHRRIHELWGFGFLEDLDNKSADYPLNDPNLWVNLEVSVNQDGTLHKVTIAKTSGKTEFDVAAVDTVISAAPYDTTPEAIRSVDGRIYLRWGFYRNWRQCGTFNVEPYILTEVPDDNGVGALDDGAMVANVAKVPGSKHHAPTGTKTVTPDDGLAKQKVNPDSTVTDKQALFAANLWVSAFATAEVDKLVKLSTVPFYAGGKVAAQTTTDLKEMYSGLVVESGPMKDWKLMTPNEYASGGAGLPEGNVVLRVRTEKESFAVVLTQTKSGDYRATQLAR